MLDIYSKYCLHGIFIDISRYYVTCSIVARTWCFTANCTY